MWTHIKLLFVSLLHSEYKWFRIVQIVAHCAVQKLLKSGFNHNLNAVTHKWVACALWRTIKCCTGLARYLSSDYWHILHTVDMERKGLPGAASPGSSLQNLSGQGVPSLSIKTATLGRRVVSTEVGKMSVATYQNQGEQWSPCQWPCMGNSVTEMGRH